MYSFTTFITFELGLFGSWRRGKPIRIVDFLSEFVCTVVRPCALVFCKKREVVSKNFEGGEIRRHFRNSQYFSTVWIFANHL
jgi:hypothetical protein